MKPPHFSHVNTKSICMLSFSYFISTYFLYSSSSSSFPQSFYAYTTPGAQAGQKPLSKPHCGTLQSRRRHGAWS